MVEPQPARLSLAGQARGHVHEEPLLFVGGEAHGDPPSGPGLLRPARQCDPPVLHPHDSSDQATVGKGGEPVEQRRGNQCGEPLVTAVPGW